MDSLLKTAMTGAIALSLVMAGAMPLKAMEGPDVVELDSLSQLYNSVTFDHVMHVDVTEQNCTVCHHHTTGSPPQDANCARCHATSGPADEVSCQGCHPANRFDAEYLKSLEENTSLYHTGKVGLKGAYHLKCLGCHRDMGAPTGCLDCHERNDAGDKLFRAGTYAPSPKTGSSHGH